MSRSQIGFSQRVRLEWFEQTANLVLAGNDKTGINDSLQDILKDKVSIGGEADRGNREKIITILLKVWVSVPSHLDSLRTRGLELLKRFSQEKHLPVHWGMVMAAYPFWADVAVQTGRLLKLQGSVAAAHVQRRMREQYGERETVSRAVRRVLRSYLDWEVLSESGKKGSYRAGLVSAVDDTRLIAWLVEACLHSRRGGSAPLKELIISPSLFPFKLAAIPAEGLLSASENLDVLRHGLDDDLVMLLQPARKHGQ